jgi:hypothetical protein
VPGYEYGYENSSAFLPKSSTISNQNAATGSELTSLFNGESLPAWIALGTAALLAWTLIVQHPRSGSSLSSITSSDLASITGYFASHVAGIDADPSGCRSDGSSRHDWAGGGDLYRETDTIRFAGRTVGGLCVYRNSGCHHDLARPHPHSRRLSLSTGLTVGSCAPTFEPRLSVANPDELKAIGPLSDAGTLANALNGNPKFGLNHIIAVDNRFSWLPSLFYSRPRTCREFLLLPYGNAFLTPLSALTKAGPPERIFGGGRASGGVSDTGLLCRSSLSNAPFLLWWRRGSRGSRLFLFSLVDLGFGMRRPFFQTSSKGTSFGE